MLRTVLKDPTSQTMLGQKNHSIDFENAFVIDKGDYRVRKNPWVMTYYQDNWRWK